MYREDVDDDWESPEDRRERQLERAEGCAFDLAGSRATHAIMRAMLSLVEAVEKDGGVADPVPEPPVDARKVLVPKKKPKPPPKAAEPLQEGLW